MTKLIIIMDGLDWTTQCHIAHFQRAKINGIRKRMQLYIIITLRLANNKIAHSCM